MDFMLRILENKQMNIVMDAFVISRLDRAMHQTLNHSFQNPNDSDRLNAKDIAQRLKMASQIVCSAKSKIFATSRLV